jgi:hypothetical protein
MAENMRICRRREMRTGKARNQTKRRSEEFGQMARRESADATIASIASIAMTEEELRLRKCIYRTICKDTFSHCCNAQKGCGSSKGVGFLNVTLVAARINSFPVRVVMNQLFRV